MFLRPFGSYCSASFGSLSVSILCTCCSHFFWYCFISFTVLCAPVFCLTHWFFSLFSFVIPSKCLTSFFLFLFYTSYPKIQYLLPSNTCSLRALRSFKRTRNVCLGVFYNMAATLSTSKGGISVEEITFFIFKVFRFDFTRCRAFFEWLCFPGRNSQYFSYNFHCGIRETNKQRNERITQPSS